MDEIMSIGIDIGTTTTQVVFSKLTLKNTAGSFVVPRIEITDKEILHKSQIYFTPIIHGEIIDVVALREIIKTEFVVSGYKKENIYTGAIIITGETVRKQNAEEVAHGLSEFAGDFVVATAGPDFEASLAGYGSGAYNLSKEMNKSVVNFDIGGGTTNACVFNCGEIKDCYALDIGGRLIRFSEDKKVEYVSERLKSLIQSLKLDMVVGEAVNLQHVTILVEHLAEMFLELIGVKPLTEATKLLFIEHENIGLSSDFVTFSGGVAEYIYSDETMAIWEACRCHMDMGPLLGYAIRRKMNLEQIGVLIAKEKIRATVIGAGNHSMNISGSTVTFDEQHLPIKNIPIVKVKELVSSQMNSIKNAIRRYDQSGIALAFKGNRNQTYEEIKHLADLIIELFQEVKEGPMIICVENDFAKALGQTVQRKIAYKRDVICLDHINVENGDYMDIGKPVSGVVPVIIKTLIFS